MVFSIPGERASGAAGAEALVLLHAMAGAALGPGAKDASSVVFAVGFALARGRARAFLAPLAPLWLSLRALSGPLALGAALPLASVAVLLFPLLRLTLPSTRPRIAAAAALIVAAAGGGARAILYSEERAHVLVAMDTIFLAPFAAHFDALAAGWLLGRIDPPRLTRRAAAGIACGALVAACAAAIAVGNGEDFICRASREGAFVPFVAALYFGMDSLPAFEAPPLIRALYSALVIAAPARRFLNSRWCAKSSSAAHLRWSKVVCVTPILCEPGMSHWNLHRCSSAPSLADGGIHPVIFIPILFSIGLAYFFLVQSRLERMFLKWTALVPDWPILPDVNLPLSDDKAHNIEGVESFPKRQNSTWERLLRLAGYYAGITCFFGLFLKVGLPLSLYLARKNRNPVFCSLPSALYHCTDADAISMRHGVLQQASRTLWFKILLASCRVVSMLALPTLVVNIVLHVLLPRANWKRMHSVGYMLRNAAVSHTGKSNRGLSPSSPVSEVDEPVDSSSAEHVPQNDTLQALLNIPCAKLDLPRLFQDELLPLDLSFVVYFRYVTRGSNPRLLRRNCRRAASVLRASGLPDAMWRVEVVTDTAVDLNREISNPSIYELVVPSSYSPPKGALYKARALEYAIDHSPARDHDWIVHLDEETRFDADTVTAIIEHCGREMHAVRVAKRAQYPRIGQGPIVYGRAMVHSLRGPGDATRNWVTTLADSSRVSDDCGRFRGQYECGEVWVGMHGSFVVAPNAVERLIRFDHGVEGSIAEDAYFALLARAAGVRFAWIDALMFEQSPFSWSDFVKQRARWLVGGQLVVRSPCIPFWVRPIMGTLSLLWSAMPVTYLALFCSVLLGSLEEGGHREHWFYAVVLPLGGAVSIWGYFFGFCVTFIGQRLGCVRFLVLLYLQIVLTPVFGIMEVSAVLYGLFYFKKLSVGFHVVDKDASLKKSCGGQSTETTRLLDGP